jgi:hypothetical protein
MSKLRLLLLKLALAACTFVLCLLVAEAGVRLFGFRPIFSVYSKPSIFWTYHPLLGWAHEPGSVGTYVGPKPYPLEYSAEVRINSLGLRGPEVPARAPGALRLMFVGDSMVAAFEVPYERSFAQLTGARLGESLGVPVQVINAGVRGYGTDQTYLWFREQGRELDPDAVVLVYSANDARDNIEVHRMRRPFGKGVFRLGPTGELELIGTPVPTFPLCSQYTLAPDWSIARTDSLAQRLACQVETGLTDRSALFTVMTFGLRRHPQLVFWLYRSVSPEHVFTMATGRDDVSRTVTEELLRQLGAEVRRVTGRELLIVGDDPNLVGFDPASVAGDTAVFNYQAIYDGHPTGLQFNNDSHFTELGHERVATVLTPRIAEWLAPAVARAEGSSAD